MSHTKEFGALFLTILAGGCAGGSELASSESELGTNQDLVLKDLRRNQNEFVATICNLGTAQTPPADVVFFDTTDPSAMQPSGFEYVPALAPSACQDVVTPCGPFGSFFSCTGTVNIRADIDLPGFVEEDDETNNGLERRFSSTADFAVNNIRRTTTDFIVNVCNTGAELGIPIDVELADVTDPFNFQLGPNGFLPQLNIGECQDVLFPCGPFGGPFSCSGEVQVQAQLDAYNFLEESNESNNNLEVHFTSGEDAEITDLRRTPFDFSATICNNGDQMLYPIEVEFHDVTDPTVMQAAPSMPVGPLNIGECQNVNLPCMPFSGPSGGPFDCTADAAVYVDVDPYNLYPEADETNNDLEVSFFSSADYELQNLRRSPTDIIVTVCNNGVSNPSPIDVEFYDVTDPSTMLSAFYGSVPPLSEGQCQDLNFPCGPPGGPLACEGDLRVRAELDPYDILAEANEDNNSQETSFSSAIDLSVSNLRRSATDFIVTVCNNGSTTAQFADVEFIDVTDPYSMFSGLFGTAFGLGAGQCQDVITPCTPLGSTFDCNADINVRAEVDAYNFITETDETNNDVEARFGNLGNRASTIDLTISSITRDPQNGYQAQVCNNGSSPATDFIEVPFFTRDPLGGSWFLASFAGVNPLGPGACAQAIIPCFSLGDGSCADRLNVRAVADAQNLNDEWDEGNNAASQYFDSVADAAIASITRDPQNGYQASLCNTSAVDINYPVDVQFFSMSGQNPWNNVALLGAPSLPANLCFDVFLPCSSIGDGTCADDLMVRATLNIAGPAVEANAENNALTVRFNTNRDLSIASITRDVQNGYMASVCNTGSADIFNGIDVSFFSSQPMGPWTNLGSYFAPPVAPGSCADVYLPCSEVGDGSCGEAVDLRAVVDSSRQFAEQNEANNSNTTHFATGRDLAIHSLTRDTQNGYSATVCNTGSVDVLNPVDVAIFAAWQQSPWNLVNTQGVFVGSPGECYDFYVPCSSMGDGTCADTINVRMVVDAARQVDEVSEGDNAVTARFNSTLDLSIASITRDPMTGYSASVCNNGNAEIFNSTEVNFFVQQGPGTWNFASSMSAPNLPVGSCFDVNLPCSSFGDGSCSDTLVLRGVADAFRFVDEADEGNNALTVYFDLPVLVETPWQGGADGNQITGLNFDYAMGYHFRPEVDGEIHGLGGLFSGAKTVKLFERSSGQLLAETSVTGQNDWAYGTIAPVQVTAGTEYTVAVYLAGTGGSYRYSIQQFPRTEGSITILGTAYAYTGANPDAIPVATITSAMYGQADVQFVATGSPAQPPIGLASFDPLYGAPRCIATPGGICDSGSLLDGRGSKGPESGAPNTLDSCGDGTAGSYHADESIDRIVMSTADNTAFTAGSSVRVEVTVWAYGSGTSDFLDLYHAPDAQNPNWTYLGTVQGNQSGAQTLSLNFSVPAGGAPDQAVRAQWRYSGGGGDPGACMAGPYNDRDDVVFEVL